MVITSGSVVVIGVMTTSTEKASDRIPKSIKAWRTSCCISSLTNEQAARRNLSLIWVFDNSPQKPRNSLLSAISMSSENLAIKFQHLLRQVPPLKAICSAYGKA